MTSATAVPVGSEQPGVWHCIGLPRVWAALLVASLGWLAACDPGENGPRNRCSGVVCMASDVCHDVGVCDATTGACTNPAKADGATCSDGNGCTQTDTCQSGTCVGGSPRTCAASDQCHEAGVCDPMTGACTNPPKINGAPCSDGNGCTQTDACLSGVCAGTNLNTCAASDQCHQAGVCLSLIHI